MGFLKTFIVNIFKHIKKCRASSIMNMEMPVSGSDVTKTAVQEFPMFVHSKLLDLKVINH